MSSRGRNVELRGKNNSVRALPPYDDTVTTSDDAAHHAQLRQRDRAKPVISNAIGYAFLFHIFFPSQFRDINIII